MKQVLRDETLAHGRWQYYAGQLACCCNEETTQRRFYGSFSVDHHSFAYIGNNCPYTASPHRRKAEHQLFREWCDVQGITILAERLDSTKTTSLIVLDLDPSDKIDGVTIGEAFAMYIKLAGSEVGNPEWN